MSKSDDFDGVAQGDVLLRFRLLAKKSRSEVGVAIGKEGDTYRKYETGQTELRVSQIPALAAAFGVAPRELSEALGLLVETPWDFRAALRPQLTEAQIEQKWQRHKDEPIKDQMAAVEGYLRMAERIRTEAATPPAEQPARTKRRRRSDERTARGA